MVYRYSYSLIIYIYCDFILFKMDVSQELAIGYY